MAFIDIKKMAKLRESARSGDERAKKILVMQMNGEDFGSALDEYFNPQPTPEVDMKNQIVETQSMPEQGKSKLEQFLDFNHVTKDSPEYDSFVEDFYAEFPEERNNAAMQKAEEPEEGFEDWIRKLMKEESDAIDSYSKMITKVMNCECLEESQKRRVIARLKEIRGDEEEHYRELSELLKMNSGELEEGELNNVE